MIQIRHSEDRGHANYGWLDTHHTFSFADYHDPEHVHFRALRVINEDRVMGGQGFGLHAHRDMEIISYVISGALKHQDSMGNTAVMKAGDVQRISAGTGINHSEYNHSDTEPVHFLQIWLFPNKKGVKPDYEERSFGDMPSGELRLIASGSGRDGSIPIHQDAEVSVVKLPAGSSLERTLADGCASWIQLIEGKLKLNGEILKPGDGAAISAEAGFTVSATEDAHFLVFDLGEFERVQ